MNNRPLKASLRPPSPASRRLFLTAHLEDVGRLFLSSLMLFFLTGVALVGSPAAASTPPGAEIAETDPPLVPLWERRGGPAPTSANEIGTAVARGADGSLYFAGVRQEADNEALLRRYSGVDGEILWEALIPDASFFSLPKVCLEGDALYVVVSLQDPLSEPVSIRRYTLDGDLVWERLIQDSNRRTSAPVALLGGPGLNGVAVVLSAEVPDGLHEVVGAAFDPDGNLLWTASHGPEGNPIAIAAVLDPRNGDLCVAGRLHFGSLADGGTLQDGLFLRFSNGQVDQVLRFDRGRDEHEILIAIDVDDQGNVYLLGMAHTTPPAPDAAAAEEALRDVAFALLLNALGQQVALYLITGADHVNDVPRGIAVRPGGGFIATMNFSTHTGTGLSVRVLTSAHDSNGDVLWQHVYASDLFNFVLQMLVDPAGNTWMYGLRTGNAGPQIAFVGVLSDAGQLIGVYEVEQAAVAVFQAMALGADGGIGVVGYVQAPGAQLLAALAVSLSLTAVARPESPLLGRLVMGVTQALLLFQDRSLTELGFHVFRRRVSGPPTQDTSEDEYQMVATLPARPGTGVIPFLDSGLEPTTRYRYRIVAFNSAGPSPASNALDGVTQRSMLGELVIPRILDLGPQAVGATSIRTLRVRNASDTANLAVKLEPLTGHFRILDGGGSHVLPPGGVLEVTVRYRPLEAGIHRQNLVIQSSDPNAPTTRLVVGGGAR
jgi:hypothetical protein